MSQSALNNIKQKIGKNGRLDGDDAIKLYKYADLPTLGALAEMVTLRKQSSRAYYSINRHINYSNICQFNCCFCGFSRRETQPDAYTRNIAEITEIVRQAIVSGVTEVHIVGGVHPQLSLSYYTDMLTAIRRLSATLHIKAFTAAEIYSMAQTASLSIDKLLALLVDKGLNTLPGGGAEILIDEYFRRNCPGKPAPAEWLNIHATAHRLGILSNATMLFGYTETLQQRITHLLKLRKLQDISLAKYNCGFQCFVPLPFVKVSVSGMLNAIDILKTIAISRLMLDNIDHIKAFWPMMGIGLAQTALCFGADDLGGTVGRYEIVPTTNMLHNINADTANCNNKTHVTGRGISGSPPGPASQQLSVEQIRRLINEARREPVQRDGYYKPVPVENARYAGV